MRMSEIAEKTIQKNCHILYNNILCNSDQQEAEILAKT